MLQPGLQPSDTLTKRQREVLERLDQGHPVKKIATDLGVTRAAVYQHIDRLRRHGALAETYTPSGQPARALAPRDSVLAELRGLRGEESAGYAKAIESAIAAGDAVALAYELGRLDAAGESGLALELVESALQRLSVLSVPAAPAVGP
jgi:biotin operon repressor